MMKMLMSRLGFNTTERGSALLVTLMLMVGVSLLGLGFVAVSETENAISLNQRNSAQTLAVGEAGLRVAIEWFQDPANADSIGILPPNLEVFKKERATPSVSANWYKPSDLLFDKPFRPAAKDRLYGTEKSPDVTINDETTEGRKFLDTFNAKIFGTEDATESCERDDGTPVRCVRVTDIRVFAPPIVGGTVVPYGSDEFWDGGTRYGYATIRVLAEKRNGKEVIARRTVRAVISEWPFPGPQGPVQSNANIATGGNLQVHWGKMTAMGDLGLPSGVKWPNCLPWFDANERLHFEAGWDSSHPYTNAFDYRASAGLNFTKVHSTNTANGEVAYTCLPCSISRSFGEPAFTGTYKETVDDHPGATVWAASTAYTQGQFVTTAAAPGITYEAQANGTSGAAAPTWNGTEGSLTTETTGLSWKALGAMTWTASSYATEYPLVKPGTAYQYNYTDWFYEVVSDLETASTAPRDIDDIWWEVRARGDINDPGFGTSALAPLQLIKYKNPNWEEFAKWPYTLAESDSGGRAAWAMFQGQDTTVNPGEKKEVTFPRIDYDFWKEIAIQGNGTNRVYYLRWVGAPRDDSYSNGIQTKKVMDWVNTDPARPDGHPAEAGFYFFDTKNGVNPQITGGALSPYLTPALTLNNSDANPMQMKGFVYFNTVQLKFNGVNGIDDYYGMPGEPYRDIGVRKVDKTTGKYLWDNVAHAFARTGENDGVHTCIDLNGNGICGDVGLEERTITNRLDDGNPPQTFKVYFPKPYTPECFAAGNIADNTVGTASDWVGKCSEPQEPYLNLRYPKESWTYKGGTDATPPLEVSWGDATTTIEPRAKKKDPAGVPYDCGAKPEFCTSLRYDLDGGLITLDPVMVGILYNEGGYTATGDPRFFGSILINGDVDKAGTGQVYFDETLLKGTWQDQFDFPRVFESSHETDK